MRIKKIHIFLAIFTSLIASAVIHSSASAVTGSDWQAGNIISDTVFYNSTSMSASQIQAFLNAKVPTCDTNGTQTVSSGQTRAQYSAAYGQYPPFVCLKDYSQTTTSQPAEAGLCNAYTGATQTAAQIIYSVAQACGVNPQAILVLLQKEQSLVTDDWPWTTQYQSATGYGCPDTSACDTTYYGFFNQVYHAARQFKLYQKNASSYSYLYGANNTIQYNPTASCGSSNVYIQGQATAGLYNYTPYQPNSAALNNLYGDGDSCSSYGNRNFWRIFNDWFGSTNDPDSNFWVINSNPVTGVGTWYLVTPTGKYGIPTQDIYDAWGLNTYAFQTVDTAYFSSLYDGGGLGRVLHDKYGNYFVMDGGQAHYVRDQSYLGLWGLSTTNSVQSTGLVYAKQGGDWVGRFAKDATSGQLWLIDGGNKHAIAANSPLLYQWGYTPDQLTSVSSTFLGTMADGGNLTRYFSQDGSYYVVDADRAIKLTNDTVKSAFNNSGTYLSPNSSLTSSFLNKTSVSQPYVQDATTGRWYLLGGGKRYYIPNLQTALDWGYKQGTPLLTMSSDFISSLADGGTLQPVVKDTAGNIWVLDGQKHEVSAAANDGWTSSSMLTLDDQSLSLVPTGGTIGRFIKPMNSPFIYVVVNGVKYYLQNSSAQAGWGVSGVASLNESLVYDIPEGQFTNQIVRSQAGTDYVLDGTTAYPIATADASDWESTLPPITVTDTFLGNFQTGATLSLYFKNAGNTYLVSNGAAIPLQDYLDTYSVPASTVPLSNMPLPISSQASYIVKSSDSSNKTMWFVNLGSKIAFPSFAEAANYGYVSQGQAVTTLSPSALNAIPSSASVPSLLIMKPNAGVKLLSFGYALGFPDGDTLENYVSSNNPILTVAPSVYDRFTLKRATSRVIRDDKGNLFYMNAGNRQYISKLVTGSPLSSIPQTYLEGTAIVDIPSGSDYN